MAWSVHNKRHRNQRVVVCVITNWNKGQRKGLFVCYKLRLSIGRVRVSSNLTSSIQWMVILPAPAQFLLHPTIEVKFTNCPSVKTQIHLSLHKPFTIGLLPFPCAASLSPLRWSSPFYDCLIRGSLQQIFFPISPPAVAVSTLSPVFVCFFTALNPYGLAICMDHMDCQSVWSDRSQM